MKRLLWPAFIILSTIATGIVTFVITNTPVRPFIALWFLFICPGMAPARLFRLKDPMIEWTLAIALSFAIDAIVAGILMYAGRWSSSGTLAILMAISLGGAIMQIGFSRKFDEMVSISTSTHVQTLQWSVSGLPTSIQPLINAYLYALELLHFHFYGIYIFGSIALGAFEELESDIDIIALTQGEWTTQELAQLRAIHTRLMWTYQLGKRLEVHYIPLYNLGKCDREMAPYPTFSNGKFFPAGYGDIHHVTWWIVKNKSIRLLGPERSTLPFEVAWQDVLKTAREKLDGYWASNVKRPYLFLLDGWITWAVPTLCRILTAIEDEEIITKSAALKRWRNRLPARWRLLIDEAWRIRHHLRSTSLYHSRLKRMRETLAFFEYIRERGNKVLEASSQG